MDSAQDELLAALTNFLRLSILLHELVIAHARVTTVLSQIAEEVVEEEVEGLQEIAMVLNVLLDIALGHP